MKVVLTGGKFNRIHEGHIWLLKKAKAFGDELVVVLAHDSRNTRSYAISYKKRRKALMETGIPDNVAAGDKKDFFKVVEKYRPSVIVLGYDQSLPKGVKEKLSKEIKIVKLKKHGNYETRKMR